MKHFPILHPIFIKKVYLCKLKIKTVDIETHDTE